MPLPFLAALPLLAKIGAVAGTAGKAAGAAGTAGKLAGTMGKIGAFAKSAGPIMGFMGNLLGGGQQDQQMMFAPPQSLPSVGLGAPQRGMGVPTLPMYNPRNRSMYS
jgi:hypothetical protein